MRSLVLVARKYWPADVVRFAALLDLGWCDLGRHARVSKPRIVALCSAPTL